MKNGIVTFKKLSLYPELIHGFSTKGLGDMNPGNGENAWQNIDKFLNLLNTKRESLVLTEQIHQGRAVIVGKKERGKIVNGVDGMITDATGVVLGVKIADCLPILFYDLKRKIIGVAHAGWQGIMAGIIPATVDVMAKMGAKPEAILVGTGPHIGGCCFTPRQERVQVFKEKFGSLPGMIYEDQEGVHLDLAVPAVFQLEQIGIKKENIEILLTCTSCQNQDFFSFRREKTEKRILGVIGLQ